MAYGIVRMRNLKISDLASTDKHNSRDYKENEVPENIKKGPHFSDYYEDYENVNSDLKTLVEEKLKNVKGLRKDSNVALEYVFAISDKKALTENYSASGWFSNCMDFLRKRHGEESPIIAKYEHYDESNPHCHFVIMPIKEKTIKWKNQQAQGERKELRLNAQDFNGREQLHQLQTDYYQLCKEKEKGLGVEIHRGTLAEDNFIKYSMRTNHRLGEIQAQKLVLSDEIEKTKLHLEELEIKRQKEDLLLKATNQRDFLDEKNSNAKWTKGQSFFHPKKENDKGFGMGF
jgi:hypothetical protein